jgi:hypothetical protein
VQQRQRLVLQEGAQRFEQPQRAPAREGGLHQNARGPSDRAGARLERLGAPVGLGVRLLVRLVVKARERVAPRTHGGAELRGLGVRRGGAQLVELAQRLRLVQLGAVGRLRRSLMEEGGS